MSNKLSRKFEAITLAGATGLALALGGCATGAERPAPAATATQGGETDNDAVKENWADIAASVDKYPDVVSAAEYLMGGPKGDGVYSRILRYAGRRGEDTSVTATTPKEALVALFGAEPAEGYSSDIQNIIRVLNENYALLASAYYMTKDAAPFECETLYTDVSEVSDDTASGVLEMRCVTVGMPGDNKVNSKAYLDVTVEPYTDDSGKEVWRVTNMQDGDIIEAPHDNGDIKTLDD